MARPLPILLVNDSSAFSPAPSSGLILTFLAILFILSAITKLCADHKTRASDLNHPVLSMMANTDQASHDQSAKHGTHRSFLSNLRRNASTKAILKVITWGKVQHDQDEAQKQKAVESVDVHDHDADGEDHEDHDDDVDGDDAVWRKGIILGGRCKPLDISGKIEYDSRGNPLREQHQDPERDFIGNWGDVVPPAQHSM